MTSQRDLSPPAGGYSAMSPGDSELLWGELRSCRAFLEFGAGDSTRLAASVRDLGTIVSVESDIAYVEALLLDEKIATAVSEKRLVFLPADIGPIAEWGMPGDYSRRAFWPLYALRPFTGGFAPDLVLVDGRFRVACALAATLANSSARILVHDYPWRPEYAVLTRFFEFVHKGDTMAVFVQRPDFDTGAAERMLKTYQYAPDDFPKSLAGFAMRLKVKLMRRFRRNLFQTFAEVE